MGARSTAFVIGVVITSTACTIETHGLAPRSPSRDAGGRDAGGIDATPPADAFSPDATERPDAGPRPCGPADGDTVALWDFESGLPALVDAAGDHDGEGFRSIAVIAGPPGCGQALRFNAATEPPYAVVPDSGDWDLSRGSIDLWLLYDAPDPAGAERGILSRDAFGSAAQGHFTLALLGDGTVVARLQRDGIDYAACSDAIPARKWVHIGVGFGTPELELYIDGVKATRLGTINPPLLDSIVCGRTLTGGIEGNDNPWVFGAAAWSSSEGGTDSLDSFLAPAAIDHVRISRVRRDFTR